MNNERYRIILNEITKIRKNEYPLQDYLKYEKELRDMHKKGIIRIFNQTLETYEDGKTGTLEYFKILNWDF